MDQLGSHIEENRFDSRRKNLNNRFDSIAHIMAEQLHDPNGLGFYYTIAKQLSEPRILELVAIAKDRGRNPGAYFNALARKEIL